jgi:AcrR family transcriptional regulator
VPIDRQHWVASALEAFRGGGVDAVSVEALARRLGVTKGSFYWHFADRAELLEELLRLWEEETTFLIEQASREGTPLARVLGFFAQVAEHRGEVPDTEYFAWARRDPAVARRADAVEARRIEFIRRELEAAAITRGEAARRAEAGYLATLGWIDRAVRTHTRGAATDFRRFTEYLFELLFEGVDAKKDWQSFRRRRARSARR